MYRIDGVHLGEDPKACVLAIGHQLGTVLPQRGEEVLELVPIKGSKPNSPNGYGSFPLHTDGMFKAEELSPDLIVMLCVHPGEGGESLLVDGRAVIEELRTANRVDVDALLNRKIIFCHIGATVDSADGAIVMPVVPPQEDTSTLYTGPIYNQASSRLRYSTTLMNRIGGDFEVVSAAMQQSVSSIQNVNSGTLWIIDDKRMLHGRGEIHSADRKILRVHVKLPA